MTTGTMAFCRGCGKEIHETAVMCPHCGYAQQGAAQAVQNDPAKMTFVVAIKTCFSKYATFKGRASRSEYWFFVLFCFLLSILERVLGFPPALQGLISLAIMLPSLAVACRRLHDFDRSGWNQLWSLTIIGAFFPVLYWLVQPSNMGSNRFGASPQAVLEG